MEKLLTGISAICRDAGKAILEVYERDDFGVETKSDQSPLTAADLAAHKIIVAGLNALAPDIPVLSEESDLITFETRQKWTRYFLVDPLDGTKEFIKRNGEFTVNVALIDNNRAILGVVYVPVQNVLYAGTVMDGKNMSREDPRVRERYSAGAGRYRAQSERFLLARRLVEAGVRYVGLNWGGYLGFDTHKNNYPGMRRILPPLDWALSALLEDLYQRGLERDVLVIVWGEFGRTPKINKDAGRDHWPAVQSALIAGGGLKMGGVIGATDRWAAEPTKRPVHVHEILSTAYHHLGIDVERTTLTDSAGRPRYLLDVRDPIRELL